MHLEERPVLPKIPALLIVFTISRNARKLSTADSQPYSNRFQTHLTCLQFHAFFFREVSIELSHRMWKGSTPQLTEQNCSTI
jgi:hypothetical protein